MLLSEDRGLAAASDRSLKSITSCSLSLSQFLGHAIDVEFVTDHTQPVIID